MDFFKPKHSVCSKCGNHFEPLPKHHGEYMFRHLCAEHRKPEVEMHWRMEAVKFWAADNWLALEEQMKAEQTVQSERAAAWHATNQSATNGCYGQYNAASQGQAFNLFGTSIAQRSNY